MNRRLLFFGALITALFVAVVWLTRDRPEQNRHAVSNGAIQQDGGRSGVTARDAEPIRTTRRATASSPQQTFMELPVSGPATLAGIMAVASVQTGEQKFRLTPNQAGRFNRVRVVPNKALPVSVEYAEGEPGQNVVVEVEDGGELGNGKGVEVVKLDSQRQVNFSFKADATPGKYQVVLRKGVDEKVLEFWVGPDLPVAKR